MQNTKKLLSISNLKKYFPVAKSSFFQKEQLYVRANEDISLDIYEGETIGVVGESGCGKSTLGRVLLQLYPQTAGTTLYYGSTLEDTAPAYVAHTLKNLDSYKKKLDKAAAKVVDLDKKVEAAGGEDKADFYLLQNRNLARCEQQTCLSNIVKILGGFFAVDPNNEGRDLMLVLHNEHVKCKKVRQNYIVAKLDYEHLANAEGADKNQAKIDAAKAKMDEADKALALANKAVAEVQVKLDALRAKHAGNEEFDKYEAMRDNGIDLARLTYSEMRGLRSDLQLIFQDPYSSLNSRMTVGQIIGEGMTAHKFFRRNDDRMKDEIIKVMEECGLAPYFLHRYPHQFSGGQRQRIGIARSLALRPKFVVCDEAVSALDVSIQAQIINLLQDLKEKQNLTYLFITHDLSVVKYISDRIGVMYLGNMVETAPSDDLFAHPLHPYTEALLNAIPTTDEDSSKKPEILQGDIPSPVNPPKGCKFHTRCKYCTEICTQVVPQLEEGRPNHFVACHHILEANKE